MHRVVLTVTSLLALTLPLAAETADEILAKYIKTIGGIERINALQSLRRTGTFTGGGGMEAKVVEENRRPALVRQEFTLQGMTGVTAYDGAHGWKIEPWGGKRDPEPLGEEELKGIVDDADLDGPLINYERKGHKLEYLGMEPVEGTDAHKLKLTMASGDVRTYFMDTDYYVPIRMETQRMVRGSQREYETTLGDYKEVNGVYLPFSIEQGLKGSPFRSKITYERIEANVDLPDARFREPAAAGKAPAAADASATAPRKDAKSAVDPKPPVTRER